MPWVRIDENAMDHPKIGTLPDGAFRLWVQGLAHCQRHLTDGMITDGALRMLRAYSQKRTTTLIDTGLWERVQTGGVLVHDYLQWNDSREQVMHSREMSRQRIARLRGKKRGGNAVTTPLQRENTTGGVVCISSCSEVREGGSGETSPSQRAGAFCQWYEDTHDRLFRVGYMGTQNDYQTALRLVEKFTDAQLRDAALVWFGMDDDFAMKGTRTVAKFASRITGCLQLMQARGIA